MKSIGLNQTVSILLLTVMTLLSWSIAPGVVRGEFLDQIKAGQLEARWRQKAAESFEEEGRPPKKSRTSGGSRISCQSMIVALVPGEGTIQKPSQRCLEDQSSVSLGATTAVAQPVLWFYVSTTSQSPLPAELILLNQESQVIAVKEVMLSQKSGIVGVSLPQELEAGAPYLWSFSVLEDPKHPSKNPFAEGWVKWEPTSLTASSEMAAATPTADELRKQAAQSASQDYWHDTVTTLAKARRSYPQDLGIAQDWSHLLTSIGLGAFADVPITDCCEVERPSQS